MVDSAVDDPLPGSNPLEVLAIWRQEVSAAYQGHPTLPVTISLVAHLQEFDIPEQVWSVLDDVGLREELEAFSRRYVQELVMPWYDEATTRR